jgi:hypothetical protein
MTDSATRLRKHRAKEVERRLDPWPARRLPRLSDPTETPVWADAPTEEITRREAS